MDGFGSGDTLAVDESFAEWLVGVECGLIGGETFTDVRNVAGFLKSSGDEARLEMTIRMVIVVGDSGVFGEGTQPAAKVD